MTPFPKVRRECRFGVAVCFVGAASCALISFAAAVAQDAGQVTIDAARCREIASPEERLACFEAEVDDAIEAGPPPAAVPPPPAAAPREWVGTVAALSYRAPNKYLITLHSGEMFEQVVAERYILRVGQQVRVYTTQWGTSQRLEADGQNGFIQVMRVR